MHQQYADKCCPKMSGSSHIILIMSNVNLYNFLEIMRELKKSEVLLDGATNIVGIQLEKQKDIFFSHTVGKLVGSLLENMFTQKSLFLTWRKFFKPSHLSIILR